jgi:hypothetical protein
MSRDNYGEKEVMPSGNMISVNKVDDLSPCTPWLLSNSSEIYKREPQGAFKYAPSFSPPSERP